jgi:trehalose 6-phosphate synthase/phosphatase
MNKTIIVSNRLPLQIKLDGSELQVTPSVGGLATGMKSVHRDSNGLWIGWSGLTDEELHPELSKKVERAVSKEQCATVNLNKEDIKHYYYGFSNRMLWPLFHYFIEYTEFSMTSWEAYKRVNEKFAEVVIAHANDGDKIWIHDYQLLLLPQLIKDKKPHLSIGFFLHIPFPSFEIFRTFPKRKEILEGMLGADLLGFHTYDYERHFLSSVKRILHCDVSFNKITYQNRTIKVDSFPMGIDYQKFEQAALKHNNQSEEEKSEVQKRLDDHLVHGKDVKMVLSIDRLDYTKGIPNRIRAFEYFLTKYPQYKEKIRLIMLAVPSRSKVPQYKRLKEETDELVGRVNGAFSTVSWTPIWYFFRTMPFENLIDLYTSCDIALITPVRDGMNLVAKEYVATRTNDDGVLVLSEMAGATKELNEAIHINPYDLEDMANSLKQAIDMPLEEQQRRMKSLKKRVSRYHVKKWASDFISSLNDTQNTSSIMEADHLDDSLITSLTATINSNETCVLFLDYDGTLVNFSERPEEAVPDPKLLELLHDIDKKPNVDLVIISGRDQKSLNNWFKHTPFTLISDHGVSMRSKGENWKILERLNTDWMEDIKPVLESFADRTPGSFIEEKNFSLAWHYRNADIELAQKRLSEINTVLTSFISNTDLTLLDGNKVLEVKSSKVNKGRACNYVLQQHKYQHIFAFGDDWTDEFMFEDLPKHAHTVKIGLQKTKARYYLDSVEQVRAVLTAFARS